MIDAEPPPAAPRRRPPRGRVAPEALAAARGGAVEGLAWLGRTPESKASLLYRFLRLVGRFVLFVVFRFRIRTSRSGEPAERRLLPRRSRPSRLDGPVRRPPRDPGQAARLVPRQRAIDFHVALARAADPPARWLAARLARRGRSRRARRLGARGRRQWRRLRPDAGGHRQRSAGPDRPVPGRLGGHRAADRRRRSCRSPSPAQRSCTSAGGWRSRILPATTVRELWPASSPIRRFLLPAAARSSTSPTR